MPWGIANEPFLLSRQTMEVDVKLGQKDIMSSRRQTSCYV